jgi:hypothetical protein
MIEINGQPAEIAMTLEITRAATGEKETVDLIGIINPIEQENENVSNTFSDS